jgi:hypothetical protein
MKPSFIVIGAARSGSTSLYQYLNAHPAIYMSPVKELNFFSNEKYWAKGLAWYETNFAGAVNGVQIAGEVSPSYTKAPFTENVAQRIYDYNPDIKLIYVVRSPIERLISHYLHRVQRGYESRDFSTIIKQLDSVSSASQGRYYYQAEQFLKYFRKDQLCVISFDALKSHTQQSVAAIYQFIGVDSAFQIQKADKIHNANKSITKKNRFGLAVMAIYHNHMEQKNIPNPLRKLMLKLSNIGGTQVTKPTLSDDQYATLRAYYQADSEKLSQHFGVEIKRWYRQ